MSITLSNENLGSLPKTIQVPGYDRSKVTAGILHIGPSAFFRAHLAVIIDDLLTARARKGEPLNWGITCVSMKTPDVRDALAPQDNLYTVTSKGQTFNTRAIGSICDIMVAKETPDLVKELAANPDIKVISLTVTQAGYYHDADKEFDFDHPDIKSCLAGSPDNISSIGLIVSALELRMKRGLPAPVIMSCDNLPTNGTVLRKAVLGYAERKAPELHAWIAENVKFPDTMVDRITPRKSDTHIQLINDMGVRDSWPVEAEPMPAMPLVVENTAAAHLPDLAPFGVIVSDGVAPYEMMKVRTLNGAHMALGCIGYLSGYNYTHEAMKNPDIRAFVEGFMKEAGQTLKPAEGVDPARFRQDVTDRLDNPSMVDQLTRLSRNGCDKLSGRILETIRDLIASGKNHDHLAFAVASWIEYAKDLDETGCLRNARNGSIGVVNDARAIALGINKIVHTDPMGVFAVTNIFGDDFSKSDILKAKVQRHLQDIQEKGIQSALNAFVKNRSVKVEFENVSVEPPVLAAEHGHHVSGMKDSLTYNKS